MTNPMAEASDPASAWPEAPKFFSVKGFAWGGAVLVLATVMALAILMTRHMENQRTMAYWDAAYFETIGTARPVELLRPAGSQTAKELEMYHSGWIDLSEFRDLAYFRRAFLADSNFQWHSNDTPTQAIPPVGDQAWPWVFVRFGQDDQHAEALTVAINVETYWVGKPGAESGIQLNAETGRRLSKRLKLISRVEP